MKIPVDFKNKQHEEWVKAPIRKIDHVNWPAFPYKPEVLFKIIPWEKGLYLKFWVHEANCRGLVTDINGPVYKDSCVEFFVSPAFDALYYNFEFNCIGNILIGCGQQRQDRIPAPVEVTREVICRSSLGYKPVEIYEDVKWELDVYIPYSAFFLHKIKALSNLNCNFYKCGDETLIPHYLTWLPIKTERPDFHRPQYFGTIQF